MIYFMKARSHTGRSRVNFNSGPRSPSRRTKNKVSFYEVVAYEKLPLFFLKKHQPAAVLTPICNYICQNTRAITSVIQVKTAAYAEKMAARQQSWSRAAHTKSASKMLIHSMSPLWQGMQCAFITESTVLLVIQYVDGQMKKDSDTIKIIQLFLFEINLYITSMPKPNFHPHLEQVDT